MDRQLAQLLRIRDLRVKSAERNRGAAFSRFERQARATEDRDRRLQSARAARDEERVVSSPAPLSPQALRAEIELGYELLGAQRQAEADLKRARAAEAEERSRLSTADKRLSEARRRQRKIEEFIERSARRRN